MLYRLPRTPSLRDDSDLIFSYFTVEYPCVVHTISFASWLNQKYFLNSASPVARFQSRKSEPASRAILDNLNVNFIQTWKIIFIESITFVNSNPSQFSTKFSPIDHCGHNLRSPLFKLIFSSILSFNLCRIFFFLSPSQDSANTPPYSCQ
jgi:hypothetical protein